MIWPQEVCSLPRHRKGQSRCASPSIASKYFFRDSIPTLSERISAASFKNEHCPNCHAVMPLLPTPALYLLSNSKACSHLPLTQQAHRPTTICVKMTASI